jgi:hypothetical protein
MVTQPLLQDGFAIFANELRRSRFIWWERLKLEIHPGFSNV